MYEDETLLIGPDLAISYISSGICWTAAAAFCEKLRERTLGRSDILELCPFGHGTRTYIRKLLLLTSTGDYV